VSHTPSPARRQPVLTPRDTIALAGTAVAALVLLAITLGGGAMLPPASSGRLWLLPLAGAAAVVVLGFALLYPRKVFPVFVLACMAMPMVLEQTYVPLGFMKLYVQDVVFGFNVLLIAGRALLGRIPRRWMPFNWFVLGFFAFGAWGIVNGLVFAKNPYDDVFGDFRRAFFYFMNYFIALYLTDTFDDVRWLRNILVVGSAILIARGMFDIATGRFYTRRFDDAAHILTWKEVTFLSFGVFYALARVLYRPAGESGWRGLWRWLVLAGLGLLVTAVGNFRATWIGMAGGLGLMFFFLPRGGRLRFLLLGASAVVVMALAMAVLWDTEVLTNRTLGEEITSKARVKGTTDDINVQWRFQSYEAALQAWRSRPVLGTGLGTYLTFHAPTSTGGSMLAEGHNVHNSLLWYLMVLGLAGFTVTMLMHGAYLWTALRFLRASAWNEGRATVLASASFYISMMGATLFQNFLENATPVTVFSATVAVTMLTIREGIKNAATRADAS